MSLWRLSLAAAAAILPAVLCPSEAWATTESFCSFPSALTSFTYNENAFEADNSVIRLTDAVDNELGSAWLTTPVPFAAATAFHAHFTFQMGPNTGGTGGEGLAFVLQNSAAGASALGGAAAGMGYKGITPSVVIAFDTVKNSGPNANNVSLLLNGSNTVYSATGTPTFTMAGAGLLNAWVDYNGTGTITASVSNTATKPGVPTLSFALNLFTQLGSQFYVGFTSATAATGTVIDEHDIFELEFSTAGIPCTCEGDSACGGATPACSTSGVCAICSATNATACTGATPVCDVATQSCVGCLTNANCASPTPICGATNACRACTGPSDCGGATPECATTGAHAGDCVACVSDTNCPPSTPRCTASNTCVQCETAADCGGDTPVCASGTCIACRTDTDCSGATPACEVWGACGQCSATNAKACAGATDVCDYPSGTCVGCEFNSDCSGMTPTCNTATHTCRACAHDTDCMGSSGGPACVLTGMKAGSCVTCTVNSDCTSAAAPICDTVANHCVECLVSTDCASSPSTPVCNAENLCVGCVTSADCNATSATPVCNPLSSSCTACVNDYSATNPGQLSCPTAALPACQPSGGSLAGTCGVCSATNASVCVTEATTPVCVASVATCGCALDTDCPANNYCDTSTTSTGVCTTGCRVVGDSGATNCATGEYCTATDGSVGTCMSEPCSSNKDCSAPLGVCDTILQPHVCVACLNASDCVNEVCSATNQCVECTPAEKQSCKASGAGAACLAATSTCGCTTDADCGGATSGRICTKSACVEGCRGSGGNGCAPPDVCSSSGSAAGTCKGVSIDGGTTKSDGGKDSGSSVDAGVDSGVHVVSDSTGCGCRVLRRSPRGSDQAPLRLVLALGMSVAIAARRRSRRRRAPQR